MEEGGRGRRESGVWEAQSLNSELEKHGSSLGERKCVDLRFGQRSICRSTICAEECAWISLKEPSKLSQCLNWSLTSKIVIKDFGMRGCKAKRVKQSIKACLASSQNLSHLQHSPWLGRWIFPFMCSFDR